MFSEPCNGPYLVHILYLYVINNKNSILDYGTKMFISVTPGFHPFTDKWLITVRTLIVVIDWSK